MQSKRFGSRAASLGVTGGSEKTVVAGLSGEVSPCTLDGRGSRVDVAEALRDRISGPA